MALLVAFAVVAVAAAGTLLGPRPPFAVKSVAAPPEEVLLTSADIPDVGWGARASGMNGSAAWRVFAAHSEVVIATFNVTLWVEANATAAAEKMNALSAAVAGGTEDGGVAGADASAFWSRGQGRDAGIVVLRYNVVFVLLGTSETPMSLTKSDLGMWAGWQLERIERLAS